MHQSDKVGGYHIVHSNQAELPRKIDQGYRFIAYGDDMVFLSEDQRGVRLRHAMRNRGHTWKFLASRP